MREINVTFFLKVTSDNENHEVDTNFQKYGQFILHVVIWCFQFLWFSKI